MDNPRVRTLKWMATLCEFDYTLMFRGYICKNVLFVTKNFHGGQK